jgi:hypothetical protein
MELPLYPRPRSAAGAPDAARTRRPHDAHRGLLEPADRETAVHHREHQRLRLPGRLTPARARVASWGPTVRRATISAAPLRREPVSVCLCCVQVLMHATSSDQELTASGVHLVGDPGTLMRGSPKPYFPLDMQDQMTLLAFAFFGPWRLRLVWWEGLPLIRPANRAQRSDPLNATYGVFLHRQTAHCHRFVVDGAVVHLVTRIARSVRSGSARMSFFGHGSPPALRRESSSIPYPAPWGRDSAVAQPRRLADDSIRPTLR